jgi:flagellar assembly factor FliW
MKFLPESFHKGGGASERLLVHLPFGLIGLRHLNAFELEPAEDGSPFQILRALATDGESAMEFVVVAPVHILDGYRIILRDEDVESLQILEPSAAMVLNIVAIHSHEPQHVTVNLVGPIVVNRHTLIGQQVIIENSSEFSIEHVLVDQRSEGGATAPSENPTPPLC